MTKNKSPTKRHYIYILACQNGAYYTGYTTDIDRRYQEHCAGTSKCKYTRAFPPKHIAACWLIHSAELSDALKIERKIKKLTKQKKTRLILNPRALLALIDNDILIESLFFMKAKRDVKKDVKNEPTSRRT